MTNILIACGKQAPELELLKQLPASVNIVAIGNQPEEFSGRYQFQKRTASLAAAALICLQLMLIIVL